MILNVRWAKFGLAVAILAAACGGSKEKVAQSDLPWVLLGVHSAVFDVGTRDVNIDEALGLNCAWYADILLTLTEA